LGCVIIESVDSIDADIENVSGHINQISSSRCDQKKIIAWLQHVEETR
jgi:hypothetical protein